MMIVFFYQGKHFVRTHNVQNPFGIKSSIWHAINFLNPDNFVLFTHIAQLDQTTQKYQWILGAGPNSCQHCRAMDDARQKGSSLLNLQSDILYHHPSNMIKMSCHANHADKLVKLRLVNLESENWDISESPAEEDWKIIISMQFQCASPPASGSAG